MPQEAEETESDEQGKGGAGDYPGEIQDSLGVQPRLQGAVCHLVNHHGFVERE